MTAPADPRRAAAPASPPAGDDPAHADKPAAMPDARGEPGSDAGADATPPAAAAPADSPKEEPVNLYVKNVGPTVQDDDLLAVFERFGPVVSCSVVRDPYTKLCRGFAFVKLATAAAAEAAMAAEDGMSVSGRRLNVERARRNGPHEKTPGQYLGVDRSVQERYAGYKRAFEERRLSAAGFDARDRRGFDDRARPRDRDWGRNDDLFRDRRGDRLADADVDIRRDRDRDPSRKRDRDISRERARDRDRDHDRDADSERDRSRERDLDHDHDRDRDRDRGRFYDREGDRDRHAPRRRLSPDSWIRDGYGRDRYAQDPRDIRYDRDASDSRRYRDSRENSPRSSERHPSRHHEREAERGLGRINDPVDVRSGDRYSRDRR